MTFRGGYRLQEAGYHTAIFDASVPGSGVYFSRLETGNGVAVRRMLLVK